MCAFKVYLFQLNQLRSTSSLFSNAIHLKWQDFFFLIKKLIFINDFKWEESQEPVEHACFMPQRHEQLMTSSEIYGVLFFVVICFMQHNVHMSLHDTNIHFCTSETQKNIRTFYISIQPALFLLSHLGHLLGSDSIILRLSTGGKHFHGECFA